jgi:hypothetical protein
MIGRFRQLTTLGWSASFSYIFEKRQNTIELSLRNLFSLKLSEVRVWGKNLKHQGFGASKGIKGRKIKRTKHHQIFHQKVF